MWLTVAVVGVLSIAIKTLPAVLLGGREVPPKVTGIFESLAPALLAALVVTQTVASDDELVLDARAAGVLAASGAIALRAPVLACVAVAAAAAAMVRALT